MSAPPARPGKRRTWRWVLFALVMTPCCMCGGLNLWMRPQGVALEARNRATADAWIRALEAAHADGGTYPRHLEEVAPLASLPDAGGQIVYDATYTTLEGGKAYRLSYAHFPFVGIGPDDNYWVYDSRTRAWLLKVDTEMGGE